MGLTKSTRGDRILAYSLATAVAVLLFAAAVPRFGAG
jgi:hypothetical protein